jgi:hypothetical protein
LASHPAMSLGVPAYRVIYDTGNIPFNFRDFLELQTVSMVAECQNGRHLLEIGAGPGGAGNTGRGEGKQRASLHGGVHVL